MSDLLQVSDLERAKLHDTFHSEVITGKVGGLASGADIDFATNAVTAQVQKTLPKILDDLDWSYVGLFADGVTFTDKTDFAVDADGVQWIYTGTLPFSATAGTVPSEPTYQAVHVKSASVISNANGGSVQDFIDAQYTTVADLATGKFQVGQYVRLTDREMALFLLQPGGTADGAGVLPAGLGKTAALREYVFNDAAFFGMTPGTDITEAFASAQGTGVPLRMAAGEYVITSPVEIKADLVSVGGRVVFKANGLPAGSTAVTSNGEHDILGLDVDCSGTPSLQNGFSQNLDFEPTRRLRLDVVARNVTNLDPTQEANGVLLFLGSSSPVKKVKVWGKLEGHNITATANGSIGDSAGAAQGVLSSINGNNVVVDMIWDSPRASKIYPYEDGDGIHTYDGDLGNLDSKSKYVINNPLAWDCTKRGVKIQSPNTVVNDMVVDLDLNNGAGGTALAFESLGVNTTLSNPRVTGKTNLTGDGSILASAANFTMTNPRIDVAAGQNLIRMGPGAENHSIRGGHIRSTKTYGNNALSMVTVEGGASGVIELDSVNVTTRTGSVIRYQGSSARHNFTLNGLGQAESLANVAYSTIDADIHIWSYQGDYTGVIVDNVGEDGRHTVHALYGFTSGPSVAVCASNVKFIGEGEIQATTNGILYTGSPAVGAEVSGSWGIKCTAGTGIGIDIGGGAMCRVTGVETIGFDAGTHINVNYSGKCIVTNNIGRGTGTHVSTTGATELVNRDNDLIP